MATIKSIEEKARRYDEAIKTARKINSGEGVAAPPDWTICEVIFPELKESDDEKIRKEMIEVIRKESKEFPSSIVASKADTWIAYLEKQGEQKSEEVDNLHNYLYSKQISSWSEEDKDYYDAIITKLEVTQDDALLTDNQMKFLKSLKDRVQPQPRQEWSEEDKNMLKFILTDYRTRGAKENSDIITWLKSLRPQSHWKPSDEQIKAVKETACYSSVFSEKTIDNLISLSKDLKELKS